MWITGRSLGMRHKRSHLEHLACHISLFTSLKQWCRQLYHNPSNLKMQDLSRCNHPEGPMNFIKVGLNAGFLSPSWTWAGFPNVVSVFLAPAVVAASVGGGEGFSSHREGQRPQRLQEAAQDQDQRSGALHQVRYQQICFVTTVNGDGVFM